MLQSLSHKSSPAADHTTDRQPQGRKEEQPSPAKALGLEDGHRLEKPSDIPSSPGSLSPRALTLKKGMGRLDPEGVETHGWMDRPCPSIPGSSGQACGEVGRSPEGRQL